MNIYEAMDEPVIEKGVAPPRRVSVKRYIRRLKIDESVWFDTDKPRSIRSSVSQVAAEYPERRYTCEEGDGGIRVYRIKPER